MPELINYMEHQQKGVWANIRMDDSFPCWVSIAQTGVLIKKSRLGILGKKIYNEKDKVALGKTTMFLMDKFPNKLTPPEMKHTLLITFVNAILHCNTIDDVNDLLNSKPET